MRSRNHCQSFGSTGWSSNFLISSLRSARKESVFIWSKAKPTMANCCERRPSCARLIRAGMSLRLVRSPLAPKITITHGEPVGLASVLFEFIHVVLSQLFSSPMKKLVASLFLDVAAELKTHGGEHFGRKIILAARRESL